MNDPQILFILQRKYMLKTAGVRRSQWRRLLGNDFIMRKAGNAEDFIGTWKYLCDKGLI